MECSGPGSMRNQAGLRCEALFIVGTICRQCGYDMTSLNPGATCPECGTADAGRPEGPNFRVGPGGPITRAAWFGYSAGVVGATAATCATVATSLFILFWRELT